MVADQITGRTLTAIWHDRQREQVIAGDAEPVVASLSNEA
jgi:hypothetical protein